MAGQGSAERGANRERSVKKCELTKGPAGGRLCLPDSRGAGAGRMPPLLGRPEGQNEMAVDLKDVDLKDVDLKDVDLKDVDLKDVDLNSRLQDKSRPLPGKIPRFRASSPC